MAICIGYAFLAAVFGGVTALCAKLGTSEVPSNLATFIRTLVVLILSAVLITATGEIKLFSEVPVRAWRWLMISGAMTAVSWLFYFAAIKSGPLSLVAPVDKLSFIIAMLLGIFVLQEHSSWLSILGGVFILTGVLLNIAAANN